jgi:N6-adenosine-specific RNA methylase IME4
MDREEDRNHNRGLVENTAPLPFDPGTRYPVVVIDPPWDWGDEGDADQFGRGRPTYGTMGYEELAAQPVGAHAAADSHLYLWITNRSLPKGFGLLEAWGFRYVTTLTWCKPHFGMGNYYRGQTEHVLFGVRGSLPLLRHDRGTWFEAPRPGGHSTKPDVFYELVEECSPGPWLEMFNRGGARPGWAAWGAEAR